MRFFNMAALYLVGYQAAFQLLFLGSALAACAVVLLFIILLAPVPFHVDASPHRYGSSSVYTPFGVAVFPFLLVPLVQVLQSAHQTCR